MYADRMEHARLTVNLTTKADEALKNTARLTGHSKTDIVNRALQMYEWLEMEKSRGAQFLLRDPETREMERIAWF